MDFGNLEKHYELISCDACERWAVALQVGECSASFPHMKPAASARNMFSCRFGAQDSNITCNQTLARK